MSDQASPSSAQFDTPRAGQWKQLNLAWIAFFVTFFVWFNLGGLKTTIQKSLQLTEAQVNTLLICNVALTVPARVGIGMLVDRFGPRKIYSALMWLAAIPCLGFALAHSFWQLVLWRLLISCVGAGFVVGIRLVGEWFEASRIGTAEGIYGGLGNFGMAVATFGLPVLAMYLGGENGWRYAVGLSGVMCFVYGFVFYAFVQDTPSGLPYRKPKKAGALQVNGRGELAALVFLQIPMILCLGILAWRLMGVHLITRNWTFVIYGLLALLLAQQINKIIRVNKALIDGGESQIEPFSFAQVAILCLCYCVTFGGELAVESMLPGYFEKMFRISISQAGMLGAGFAFASLIARPLGGWMGDKIGRRTIMIWSLGGSALGIYAISRINPAWSTPAAMGIVMAAGFFLMAGNGANFCIAPLIHKPQTGQIAGLIGAYGNVGSVLFLALLTFTSPHAFFIAIAITGAAAFGSCFLLHDTRALAHEARPVHEPLFSDDLTGQLAIGDLQ